MAESHEVDDKTKMSSNDILAERIHIQLRRKAKAFIAPDDSGSMLLVFEGKQSRSSTKQIKFAIKDHEGKLIESGIINHDEKYVIEYVNLPLRIWKLELDTNENSAVLTVLKGRCAWETSPKMPLRLVGFRGKLYFRVNNGTLKMDIAGSEPNEHIAIMIRDSDGNVVFKDNSLNKSELIIPVDIPVPSKQEGTIWSILFNPVRWRKFEDMRFCIKEGASPRVAPTPYQLVLPMRKEISSSIVDVLIDKTNKATKEEEIDNELKVETLNDDERNQQFPQTLQEKNNPNLPSVLVIGDSVSSNYRLAAQEALRGKFNYYAISGSDSSNGSVNMANWLRGLKDQHDWQVIVLNHGLHDLLQYTDESSGNFIDKHKVDIDLYKKNLDKELSLISSTGAKIVWCMTTPVPNSHYAYGPFSRKKDEDIKYNTVALEVLKKYPQVYVCDLNTLVRHSNVFEKWRKGANVHFHRCQEKEVLGSAVAEAVLKAYNNNK